MKRFWSKVDKSGGPNSCWVWTASLDGKGYGQINLNGRIARAHRMAWFLSVGPISPAQYLLHSCDEPRCCNPAHLRVGTQAENIADMMKRGRHNTVYGERTSNAKLTWEIVDQIRSSALSNIDLAKEIGISRSQVNHIRNGRYWREETRATNR